MPDTSVENVLDDAEELDIVDIDDAELNDVRLDGAELDDAKLDEGRLVDDVELLLLETELVIPVELVEDVGAEDVETTDDGTEVLEGPEATVESVDNILEELEVMIVVLLTVVAVTEVALETAELVVLVTIEVVVVLDVALQEPPWRMLFMICA